MRFQFDPHQEYQEQAIASVIDLFEGQPRNELDLEFTLGGGYAAVANRLMLNGSSLLRNLQAVQENNGLTQDEGLEFIEQTIETAEESRDVRFGNFSIEMETGTGKTYVYLRTALELYRRYGFRKFVIVVPSVAIREGVLKDIRMTEDHFRDLFGGIPYRSYVYDSGNLSLVRQFSVSNGLELMVMTIDSFKKDTNIIRQSTDHLEGEVPLYLVQATQPILILDEPQNMESELSVQALAALSPLFALRYSATHRNPYNLLYRLTPFDAYRQGLVKRIEVASVVREGESAVPFLRLDRIDAKRRTVAARMAVHKLMKSGTVREKVITVRPGDSLEEKTGRSDYAGYVIDEINAGADFVRLANNKEIRLGESYGADKDAIFEAQIRYTVEEHFRKQARLRDEGIKVLSLFFVDQVDSYAQDDGIVRQLFHKAFQELRTGFDDWKDVDASIVQAAYFATKRRRGGEVELIDSVTGKTQADAEAYNLIMKDKERLLSLQEPVAFIFSHSALREGWDNPNVFQICTLNQTASRLKKRQEVGRGVRLARNQEGARVFDERVNVLTVIANESYQAYVSQLQSEIEDEYGADGVPPKPPNARKRATARLRKEYTLKPEFKELWDRIKHKTRYRVRIDTEGLLDAVVPRVARVEVGSPRVEVTKALFQVGQEDAFEALQMSAAKTAASLVGRYPLPNLVDIMSDLMEQTSPPVRLTRNTLLELYKRIPDKQQALDSPHEFAAEAVRILKDALADHLVEGIQYEKVNDAYEMSQLETEIESWETHLVPAQRSIYDNVIFDSQVEKRFVEGLEKTDQVKLYTKLPNWFKVPTPVGEYNPDWAIVWEDRDAHGKPTDKPLLYLVRETKSATWKTSLRPTERRKVRAGERHFQDALDVDFRVVSDPSELP